MKRREFIRNTSFALAAAAVSSGNRPSWAADRPVRSPEKMKRVACTTVCFKDWFPQTRFGQKSVAERDITLLEIPDLFADRLGVHNVEVWDKHFEETSLAYCEKLRLAAERAGSKIVNIQLDAQNYDCDQDASGAALTGALNLSHRDKVERQRSVDFVRRWMDRAAACGATSLRANTGRSEGAEFDLDITIDSFRQLAEHGQAINVKILVENHGANAGNPEKLVSLVKGVNSPYCRTLPDFGNIPKGADEAFRHKAMELLFPMAHLVSTKGMGFDERMRHTPYDFAACMRIGESSGFEGIYSAEYWDPTGMPYEPLAVANRLVDMIVENVG